MMNINEIKKWFELAIPKPTKDNQRVQLGVHLEECSEMLETITESSYEDRYRIKVDAATATVSSLATTMKKNSDFALEIRNRKELLDSLCDQIVTAIGVGHMYGFDIIGALQEVNASNFSKFVDSKPLFDENGKIKKSSFYTPPNLTPFLGIDPTKSFLHKLFV